MKEKPLAGKNESLKKRANTLDAKSDDIMVEQVQADSKKGSSELEKKDTAQQKELNGPKGLEPTRYGDWESKGRCYDF